MSLSASAIIPARYNSSRFPGKPLAEIDGVSMVIRVVRQALAAHLDRVLVATDDSRIYRHVQSHGFEAVMTRDDHNSGTERCQEAVMLAGVNSDIILNVQGDEPFIQPEQIHALLSIMSDTAADIGTLAIPVKHEDVLRNPNKVKVVKDVHGRALYFSRACIPYQPNAPAGRWVSTHQYFKHVGMYAYRRAVLDKLVALPTGKLERAESLEQLRWMENGYTIYVGETGFESPAVDTPEDLEMAIQFIRR